MHPDEPLARRSYRDPSSMPRPQVLARRGVVRCGLLRGGRGRGGEGGEGTVRDDADPAALAVAGEVALDVDGGAGCELGEVGDLEGRDDDPVAIDSLAGGVALGEEKETELAVLANRAGEAGHEADEAHPVHCDVPSSATPSGKRWLTAILLASAKAWASSW